MRVEGDLCIDVMLTAPVLSGIRDTHLSSCRLGLSLVLCGVSLSNG